MDIKKQVKEAYNLLPRGYKKKVAKVQGVTTVTIDSVIRGEVKDEDTYYLTLQSIKQVAKMAENDLIEPLNKIKDIEVIDPQKL